MIFQECSDTSFASARDSLIVEVKRRPSSASANSPVHFALTIDADYELFMSNARQKAKLVDRIGIAFGDRNASNVIVDSVRPGSIVVEWYNASLPKDPCPHEQIQRLQDIMTDKNGRLLKSFKKIFLPEFPIKNGEMIPSGTCLGGDTPVHPEEPDVAIPPEEEEVSTTDEDYLLTFIVPAVIIAVMLLLAALIACCLYKRRRYGKMSMADERTFVSKGIPIIFAEELDDQRGSLMGGGNPDDAKSPVIMKEEKPPLPPPPQTSTDDAPYHPPPPFSSNGAQRNLRPNLPPAYRKPPTYVPP